MFASTRFHHSVRAVALACAVAIGVGPVAAQVNLPSLGDTVSEQVGVGPERRLGDQVMREIRRDPDYLDDPLLLEYVQGIFNPLLGASRVTGNIDAELESRFAWEPFLVRDRMINAFALPGGFVGVYLGLISLTASRDELASVLAHELSHVTQRHIARSMVNQQRQSLVGLAAMILGVLAASRSTSPDAANAIITGGQAAAVQGMLNFSRDMEREADRVGFMVLDKAGFSRSGMALMFEKLDTAARLNDSNNYPYLRTHPLTTERIGEARARLGPAGLMPPPQTMEHELMRARARALMDKRVESQRRLQAQDMQPLTGTPAERLGVLTASVIASLQLGDPARAAGTLQRAQALLREQPADGRASRVLALLQSDVALASGQPATAVEALKPYDADASRPLQIERAQVALAAPTPERLRRSADELQTRVAQSASDATAWQTLSQVWGKLDQPLRSVRAEAEAHVATGDLSGAIERLRAGQQMARDAGRGDFIEASVIDARLRDLEAQRRELQAEMRGERR